MPGPIEPATMPPCPLATSRAMRAAAALISKDRSAMSYSARGIAKAPKVAVSTTSAPTLKKSSCIWLMRSGRVRSQLRTLRMPTTAERVRTHTGPAILSYGFRPFFLFAAVWAALVIAVWLPMLGGLLTTALSPLEWHAHELIYGYVPAIVAGFLLTAVPNWTGRLPVTGTPLLALVSVWAAGRAVTGSTRSYARARRLGSRATGASFSARNPSRGPARRFRHQPSSRVTRRSRSREACAIAVSRSRLCGAKDRRTED